MTSKEERYDKRVPAIEVLLATYNGERFLREQIDSILSQDYNNLRVLARDDGSTDCTKEILNEYAQRFPDRFQIMPADLPTGSAKQNFLKLMKLSTSQYICFADQDDVWLADKLSKTMQAMAALELDCGTATPLLVFTDLRVVDEQLKTLHDSFWKQASINPGRIRRPVDVVTHNPVTGCTALINRRLLELALDMPPEAAMHDSWIALLASAFGAWSIVREKTVLYRQHERNVIGVEAHVRSPRKLLERLWQRQSRILQWRKNEILAEAFLRIHEQNLSTKNREIFRAFLQCGRRESRFVRIAMMLRYRFFRGGLFLNIATAVDLWRTVPEDPK